MAKYKKLKDRLIRLRARLPKISRRRLLFGGAIFLVALAVIGSYYHTSSGRVLNGALARLVTAESVEFDGTTAFAFRDGQQSVKVKSEFSGNSTKTRFAMDSKTKVSLNAIDLNIDLGIAADQNAAYFRLDNARELSDTATALLGENPDIEEYQSLADRLDGSWIKIDNQFNNELSGCNLDAINSIAKNEQGELRRIFEKNQFIKAERTKWGLIEQEYDLSFDETAGQKFTQDFSRTKMFQKLKACGFSGDSPMAYPDVDVDAKMWINPWTHRPRQLMVSVEGDDAEFTMKMSMDLGKQNDIDIPRNVIPFEQLFQEYPQEYFYEPAAEAEQEVDDTPQIDLQSSQLDGSEAKPPEELEVDESDDAICVSGYCD